MKLAYSAGTVFCNSLGKQQLVIASLCNFSLMKKTAIDSCKILKTWEKDLQCSCNNVSFSSHSEAEVLKFSALSSK